MNPTLIAQAMDEFETLDYAAGEYAASAAELATDAAATQAVFGAMAGFMAIIWIIGLIGFAIWLWAIIDVARRQFTNPSDKNLWLILVIVGLFIANPIIPIIYLIVGRKKGTIPGAGQSSPTQTPPAQTPPAQTPPAENPPTQTPPAA